MPDDDLHKEIYGSGDLYGYLKPESWYHLFRIPRGDDHDLFISRDRAAAPANSEYRGALLTDAEGKLVKVRRHGNTFTYEEPQPPRS